MTTWHGRSIERVPRLLTSRDEGALRGFLGQDPALNLFQLCWLDHHGVEADAPGGIFHYTGLFSEEGVLDAVALAITHRLALVFAARERAARRLGAWFGERDFVFEHIVSADAAVTEFWRGYLEASRPCPVSARLNRPQKLLVIERERWFQEIRPKSVEGLGKTGVRKADQIELDAVFLASARMHREETLEDPLERNPEVFRRHVRHRIDTGRTFVWFNAVRQLMFKADISARGRAGVQLSGVFTPEVFRGRGIATRALFDICARLFDGGAPRVVLYVNVENHAALRVYEKIGFEYHADFRTIFLDGSKGRI